MAYRQNENPEEEIELLWPPLAGAPPPKGWLMEIIGYRLIHPADMAIKLKRIHEKEPTMKQLISIRISDATKAKLDALSARHGTQTEAIAMAIDRLYQERKRMMAIEVKVTINKQDILNWLNEDDADTAENYANLYAAALQKGLAELNSGATIEVELTDVFDHRIEVDGINGEGYERLLAELEQDYEAVCAELAEWDWLPD